MASTEATNEILAVLVGMFDAAPGSAILTQLQDAADAGVSLKQLAAVLAAKAQFAQVYPTSDTASAFADKLVANLLGDEVAAEQKEAAHDLIVGKLNAGESRSDVIVDAVQLLLSVPDDNAKWGDAKAALLNKVEVASYYSVDAGQNSNSLSDLQSVLDGVTSDHATVDAAIAAIDEDDNNGGGTPGASESLTTGHDGLTGTAGNDLFEALIEDNGNTLQNGDSINGGAGVDTLYAEIGNSQAFAIQPRLTNVENVVISARTIGEDQADNNPADGRSVQIDAGQARGVTNWESNDSRADLIIEDVRIKDTQVTKDVTITFRDSDPGNVDYAVYFDQQSLISEAPEVTNVLQLEVSNPLETIKGYNAATPLKDVPYTNFNFILNGVETSVDLDLTDALTYDDLEAALIEAFAGYPQITVGRQEDAKHFFSRDGEPRTADLFTLTIDNGTIEPAANGWTADGGLPSDNAFSAIVEQGTPESTDPLITSSIILDNVGRGSTGGDLVIGGLSTGATSTSQGVEQFDIIVQQSSKLQYLSSTNNTLEVVNLVNEGIHRDVVNGKVVERVGNLTLQGDVNEAGFGFNTAVGKPVLPGAGHNQTIIGADGQFSGYGLMDVREVNAGDFQGDISLTAALTGNVVAKYLDLQDQAPDASDLDNVNFHYELGHGNDKLALAIDSANLAAAGTATREDFNLQIETGEGNDIIEVAVSDTGFDAVNNLALWNQGNWYANSVLNSNLAIDAGAGNDKVVTYGSGNWYVDLGAGNDVIYASVDSDADNAVWVFNAVDPNIDDLGSDVNIAYGALFKSTLTVNFLGFEARVTLDANADSALDVNQAIKQAIQSDSVLSKLLDVQDGPANTLVVSSLINGLKVAADLDVAISAPAIGAFTAAAVSEYNNAHPGQPALDAAGLFALVAANAPNADADYGASVLATQGGADLEGANSIHQADNTIIGGVGNDVLVLGTGAESNDTVVFEGGGFGNDTIVNFTTDADAVANEADLLDFTAWLNNVTKVGGVVTDIITTVDGDGMVAASEVVVDDFAAFGFAAGITFGNVTDAQVLAKLNEAGGYTNSTTANLDGDVQHSLFMIENNNNLGQYKVYEVTSSNIAGDNFTGVTLVGTVDFGATQTFDTVDFVA